MITVCFFASLREQLDTDQLILDITEPTTVTEVLTHLRQRDSGWMSALSSPSLLCAVNHSLVDRTAPVNPGDEVAFFPPVTGG
ncbi:molybdopterin converting factor subunit 1 [Marinimicrobium alkaliphilum]|uniref:molybdopterin converting factor subunit 1 n=1 Tax=Marinimicrobium alkaliphilum TaxID=2202654 RepID=UPI000DBA86E7|nr:molybdopterin converting factor subunit 1 [Marinimicrobium alkaliphilum]